MKTRWTARLSGIAVVLALGSSSLVAAITQRDGLGFLGPRGTFSEQAADTYRQQTHVGSSVAFATMTHVVDALRAGQIAQGILPVASTVAGFPSESSRLLLQAHDPGFRVVAELVLPIELHLLVKPGTQHGGIRTILSHPNALGESRAFLDTHFPDIPREETASTAAAAQRVKRGDGSEAAVASIAAARLYGLETLEEAIHEDPHNATSFWAIVRPEDARQPAAVRRFIVVVDAPSGSRILSDTVSRLGELGLVVVFTNSRALPGALYGFRYLLAFAAPEPVATQRIRSTMSSLSTAGDGQLLPLGWID